MVVVVLYFKIEIHSINLMEFVDDLFLKEMSQNERKEINQNGIKLNSSSV
jgi:hypothetical protein